MNIGEHFILHFIILLSEYYLSESGLAHVFDLYSSLAIFTICNTFWFVDLFVFWPIYCSFHILMQMYNCICFDTECRCVVFMLLTCCRLPVPGLVQ